MATAKQRKAADKLVELGGNDMGRAMREAGYSAATAKTPQKLTESKGFLDLCNELGLTDNLIVQALADDIKSKPKQRVQELALAARLKGLERVSPMGGGVNFIQVLLQQYQLKPNEGSDARETDPAIQGPSESQTPA